MKGALSGDDRGEGNSLETKVKYEVERQQMVDFEQSVSREWWSANDTLWFLGGSIERDRMG